ncbi:hypothetical protein VKT23_003795 [Stygiomarasmius scandens]|uniref:Uncharacterized protein n=1 Tax=Marasmiellus scandens TaxID=2682957 RepID=A0ABR1K0K0_9AGAR
MSDEKTAATEPLEAEPKDVSESANSDPASSLRAAALLTLKSKRRKQADAQSLSIPSLPSRPMVVDTSVQLDYGHEDSIASSPLQPSADTESGQAREEGEISDSEDPAAKSNSPTSSSHRPQTVPSVEDRSTSVYSSSPRQVVLKIESPQPQPTLLDRISDTSAQPRPSSTSTLTDDGNFVQRSYFIDADHVRPGLEMNQEQYDTAKDIVLDLLGWAVPPEYLVDCGLSREIVFYVFSELNLRLPDNLDITGLVPYNPTTARSLLRDPNTPLSTNGLRSMGHPSLPPKPVPVDQMQRPSHLAESSHLNDMERQRRQELLARKAVISSRKGKASASTSPSVPPTVTNDQDVEMASLVPKETVDDFLKSIGSVSDAGETRDDHMDVDDIPGLAGPPSHSPSAVSTPVPSSATGETPQTNNFPSASEMLDSGSISRRSSASSEDASHTSGRKAAKRPVAADFVDFESAPRGHHSTNGNGAVHPHLKRKLGGSFASVSAMRRCVIDLSDSEGEDDNADNRSGLPPVVRRMSVPAGGVGRSTTPPHPPQSAGAVPNRSLAEKEAEIVKMRQMIAERERVKKLKRMESSNNSGANTPDPSTAVKQEDAELSSLVTPNESSNNDQPSENGQDVVMSDSISVPATHTDNGIGDASAQETQDTSATLDSNFEARSDSVAPSKNRTQEPSIEAVDVDSASSSSAQVRPPSSLYPSSRIMHVVRVCMSVLTFVLR